MKTFMFGGWYLCIMNTILNHKLEFMNKTDNLQWRQNE